MGICWWSPSYLRVRSALDDVSFCGVLSRRSVRPASRCGNHRSYLHAHFPKHGNDDRIAADHWCAVATNQLQRFFCANDHVWPRPREQCLDPSKNSRVTTYARTRLGGVPAIATHFEPRDLL